MSIDLKFAELEAKLTLQITSQIKAEFIVNDQKRKDEKDCLLQNMIEIKEMLKSMKESPHPQQLINSNSTNKNNFIKMDIEYDEFVKTCLDIELILDTLKGDQRWSEFLAIML
jgi:hypothetical protein